MQNISILQGADYHVKNREKDMYHSFELNLSNITQILINEQIDIYVINGDIFDFPISNESERKIVYKHIADALNVDSLKELVFINGNHDILVDKKQLTTNRENNSFDSLSKFIETLTPELFKKITYLKYQKQYFSKASEKLGWISYSLEDGMSNGNNINFNIMNTEIYNISVYHDIVKDYVDDTKLPIRKDKYEKLCAIDDFKTDLILAGDIHKNYTKIVNNKKFIYPGSTNQVNFGEGTYIKIRKKSTIFHADKKVVKKINLTFDSITKKYTNEIEDIELENFVSHITLDLNTNIIVDNFEEEITKTLSLAIFGKKQTFIKLKLANSYLTNELNIFKLVEKISETKQGKTEIYTTYDKFLMSSDVKNLEINSLTNIDNEDDDKKITIDDLKLDTQRLNDLFSKVLDKHIFALTKDIGDDKIVNDIVENIKSLFNEQIELSLSSIPNYNIVLEFIETNGFMNLGSNKIKLDIPGLVRIIGTNGIGKTTLYNMLHYVIDGLLFESLKPGNKVKNTLLVFNDKAYTQDNVIVRLKATINGTAILITRTAYRKWKTSATDDIKKSANWKDYISEVTSVVKLSVASKDGQKEFVGLEAETFVKKWFGNISNTIMILNQQKILSMLNLPSDKLQDLVLDYIGVDYLNSLKVNLPFIKNQYNLQKPKINIDDVRSDLVLSENLKKDGDSQLLILNETLNNIDNQLLIINDKLELSQKQQLDFGNIPELLKNVEINIEKENNLKNNFVIKEKYLLPIFSEIPPIENSYENENTEIKNNNIILENNLDSIIKIKESKSKNVDEKLTELKNKISELNSEVKDNFNYLSTKYASNIEDLKIKYDNVFSELSVNYKNTLLALREKQTTKNSEISELININNSFVNRNILIDKEIESGICKTCLRPLGDDFEEHKTKLLEEKNENTINFDKNKDSLILLNEEKNKIDNFVNLYSDLSDKSLSKNLKWFIDNDNSSIKREIIDNLVTLKKDIDLFNIYLVKSNNNELGFFLTINDESIITFCEKIKLLKNQVLLYEKINENILTENIDNLNLLTEKIIDNELINFISSVIMDCNDIKSLQNKNENINSKNIELNNSINLLKNEYIKSLENYNKTLSNHNDNVSKITNENDLVETHNKQFSDIESRLLEYGKNKLSYENNLEKYNNLLFEINESLTEKSTLTQNKNNKNTEIINLEKDLINVDNKIETLTKEYNNYLEYKKHLSIYGLYDKLINKDFPDIVFEYYRKFLNNTLNILLEDMNFKLYWDSTGALYMVQIKNGTETYRPVQLVSGMETCFLGLSLIYTIHLLNVKNNISHIFIDEISGQLNSGKELTNRENIVNYQAQLVLLLNKFDTKTVFVIDHHIENFYQTLTYSVEPNENGIVVYKSN